MKRTLNFDYYSKYQNKIILHSLVWLMFFSIPIFNIGFHPQTINYGFIVLILVCIIVFYFNFSFLVSRFLITKKWKVYLTLLLSLFIIHCFVFLNLEPFIPKPSNDSNFQERLPDLKNNPAIRLFPGILLFILMTSVSSFLKIYEIWNENFKKKKEIENENRITELNFLKAQLNPHFFFNSLNTIYSLSISNSEKTPEAILNLSNLMRYMLIDKKDNSIDKKVRLADELEYINNYIELQKLRITPNNSIDFKVEGNTKNVNIYPLLFISFIENAFKFGVHPVNNSIIKIAFKIEQNYLIFETVNNVNFQKNSYDSFGLGNQNSIKRLNLYYPNNKLKIEATDVYSVYLKIDLNEN